MSKKESVYYEWLKNIDPELKGLDQIPLGGFPPSFPWAEFSQKISEAFEIKDLKFSPGNIKWLEKDKLTKDLGNHLFVQQATLSTFEGKIYFTIDRENLRFLMYALLTHSSPKEIQIFDQELEQGFYRYFFLETIRCISEVDFDPALNFHLIGDPDLPDQPALGVDINISVLNYNFTARLLIPEEFLKSCKEHYSERTLSTAISQELLDKLKIPMHIEIGKVELTQDEVNSLNEGDLVLLDQCWIDPETKQGQVILSISGSPKIRASLENNHIKIMETPLFHEEINPLLKGDKNNE